jgi:DNA replication and repair protein RecF
VVLQKLTLEAVRSLASFSADIGQHTAICGPNGSGKTTVIEAIRLLSVGKSLRTNRLDEMIRFNQEYMRIQAVRGSEPEPVALEFFYGSTLEGGPRERRFSKNGQAVNYLASVGELPTVLFIPPDLDIVLGSPGARRRYLDGIFWQTSAEFRQNFMEVGRVLRERSALLFMLKTGRAGRDELQPWNELLERLTVAIQQRRATYLAFLTDYFAKNRLFPEFELAIRYQPNQQDFRVIEAKEIRLAQNEYGPHRDEVDILINDQPARQFASRGQARLALVVLKRAELEYLASQLEQSPIFLLDDVLSELDDIRGEQLLELMDVGTQKIMTCLDPSKLPSGWQQITLKN